MTNTSGLSLTGKMHPPLLRKLNFTSTAKLTLPKFSVMDGAEVDIWGVGALISQCGSLYISEELRSLGERMRSHGDTPPSAQESLKEVKKYSNIT